MKTYFYNGLDLLSDGSSKFLHGAGIDEPLQLDSATGSQPYLSDHLGSTSQLVDSLNASAKARYDYKSYGRLEGDVSNPSASNPFTYTGREEDGMGLMYYRARYYDPELEVFISQDPLGDAQRYVAGNPLKYIDPVGLYRRHMGLTDQNAIMLDQALVLMMSCKANKGLTGSDTPRTIAQLIMNSNEIEIAPAGTDPVFHVTQLFTGPNSGLTINNWPFTKIKIFIKEYLFQGSIQALAATLYHEGLHALDGLNNKNIDAGLSSSNSEPRHGEIRKLENNIWNWNRIPHK